MARCGCGGGQCNCVIVAGENTTVDGTGSVANPYVVSAVIGCEDVRPCISAGPGATYDQATGIVSADLSEQPGNNLAIAPDGGLFVPTGAATVTAGCGLTGDGSGGAPLTVSTGTWPYPCPPENSGGVVVCDANGQLRSEPRGRVTMTSHFEDRQYPDIVVPAGSDQLADHFEAQFTNPDPCRAALAVVVREADVYFDLPAGAGAASGYEADETYYLRNTGSSAMVDVHTQSTKVLPNNVQAPPGGTLTIGFDVRVGRGSGGATYSRIQVVIRCLFISL